MWALSNVTQKITSSSRIKKYSLLYSQYLPLYRNVFNKITLLPTRGQRYRLKRA